VAVYCITGIDTAIGKTVVTGLAARWLTEQGFRVITFKPVQTGCPEGKAEDILTHRKLMNCDLFPEDRAGLTCPYIFPLPAAPLLAARESGSTIEPGKIDRALKTVTEAYEIVLLEGAGGLRVPLSRETDLIGYLEKKKYPVALVTTPRLGSINHTLLSLEALANRGIPVAGLVYNHYFPAAEKIVHDSRALFIRELGKLGYPEVLIDLPGRSTEKTPNFKPLFQPSF